LSNRFALPASCVIFGLFSLSCSLRRRISPTGGAVISTACFLAYYLLAGFAESMAREIQSAKYTAALAWVPNTLFALATVVLWPKSSAAVASDPDAARRT
jgi:lipopolysaccharide export LptBFGC system permease protein LptF